MITLLSVLLACGGEAPAPAAPAAAPAPAPAAAPAPEAKGFDAKAFTCCGDEPSNALVDAYLKAQDAYAHDDATAAGAAATALATAAKGLAATAADPDKATLTAVADAAGALAGKPLADARKAFGGLSASMITYARGHAGGTRKVAEAYCPMADASWLQSGTTISNPYYGSEMLTCGYFK